MTSEETAIEYARRLADIAFPNRKGYPSNGFQGFPVRVSFDFLPDEEFVPIMIERMDGER